MSEIIPLLMTAKELAASLQIGQRTLWRMDASGMLPRSVKLPGRLRRWRRDEIIEWIEADCPSRKEWEQIRR